MLLVRRDGLQVVFAVGGKLPLSENMSFFCSSMEKRDQTVLVVCSLLAFASSSRFSFTVLFVWNACGTGLSYVPHLVVYTRIMVNLAPWNCVAFTS